MISCLTWKPTWRWIRVTETGKKNYDSKNWRGKNLEMKYSLAKALPKLQESSGIMKPTDHKNSEEILQKKSWISSRSMTFTSLLLGVFHLPSEAVGETTRNAAGTVLAAEHRDIQMSWLNVISKITSYLSKQGTYHVLGGVADCWKLVLLATWLHHALLPLSNTCLFESHIQSSSLQILEEN